MAAENAPLLAFNRGMVSPLALARVDIKRLALSAQIQENWMPRILGSMSLRQGLQYITNTHNDSPTRYIPFLFSANDTALIELTYNFMRVLVNEVPITRVAVTSAIANGTFATNLASWTVSSYPAAGGTVTWVSAGNVAFQSDGTNQARLTQAVVVAAGDANKQHAIRIQIAQGDGIHVFVNDSVTGASLVADTLLYPGTHSLAFTPTINGFTVVLYSRELYNAILNSCVVEGPGVMVLPTVWGAELPDVRTDQSADVIFVACKGKVPQRIERHGTYSWSVVEYISEDGPFGNINITPVTLAPSVLQGSGTLTASQPLFDAGYVDQLVSVTSAGQTVVAALSGANVFSNTIEVTGTGTRRTFGVLITGTFVASVTLQQSVGAPGSWIDVLTWTTPISTSYNDSLDNQIIYYRIGIKVGNYTSGTANVQLAYAAGSITGIARITGFTSSTQVNISITRAFGATTASSEWYLGDWSANNGYPTAVAIHQGRLWWAGKGKVWGTVSGSFISNDPAQVGDAGPINATIGGSMVDTISWMIPGSLFLLGGEGAEYAVRSDALDAPLTPTSFNIKPVTTYGSAGVTPLKVDQSIIFVSRSGRVYEAVADAYSNAYNLYSAQDLTAIVPEVCRNGVFRAAVQRGPDTRVHFVQNDGTVAVLVFDKAEEVKGWIKITTQGSITDVVVLPSGSEDLVYYVVMRTIGGAGHYFLEKFSSEIATTGAPVATLADAHTYYSGAATTTITGLSYLNGQTVVCWGWHTVVPFTDSDGSVIGKDFGTFVVSGGAITLPQAVTRACVGLGYQAKFQSTKLAYASQAGTALNQKKRVPRLGLVLRNTHAQGIQYGSDFTHLDGLPQVEAGAPVDQNKIWEEYDFDAMEYNDTFTADSRLCLVANAPRPCTVLAATVTVETNEKA